MMIIHKVCARSWRRVASPYSALVLHEYIISLAIFYVEFTNSEFVDTVLRIARIVTQA